MQPMFRAATAGLARCALTFFAASTALAQSISIEDAAAQAERYGPPPIRFAPCTQNPALDCGTLAVPIDYTRPSAATVDLAVIRARATGPRIGVLFGDPGGPAGSGVDFILQGVTAPGFTKLRERFDVIAFDVRGSNRSRAVRCDAPPPIEDSALPEAELAALVDRFSRDVAAACLSQNGAFITKLSTNNIARDLDVFRRALGERQVSFVGISYGSVLGSVYATMFPRHVRAMLLDAAFYAHARDGQVEYRAEQALSFEHTLQRLDRLCRNAAECRLRTIGLSDALTEVIARVTAAPVTGPGGVVLGAASVRRAVSSALSFEFAWPAIVDAVADSRGGNYDLLFQMLAFAGGNPRPGGSVLTAFTAILCNDFGTRRPASEYLLVSEATTALSSRIEPRFAVVNSVARCASWPAADVPMIREARGRVATPILMIANHFDPNTPLSWTRGMAHVLGMERHVVRYQGGGHTSFAARGNACIDQVGHAYLFDLALPAEAFSCPALPVRFTPSTALRRAVVPESLDVNQWGRLPSVPDQR